MISSICILGRQPALGMAELESLYGADKIRPIGPQAALVAVDPCRLAFDRLGGSVKFCKTLTELETTDWKKIESFLVEVSPGHSERMPAGKMHLGLSVYGYDVSIKQLEATGLTLKKAIRQTGRSVRLVPNKAKELSSAQVLHNHLTGPTGWELVFIRDGNKTLIAQTVKVQDINSYTLRDRGRPKRDPRVGMLPPKLAQIIINLAVGQLPADKLESICEIPAGEPVPRPLLNQTILDPFCGTGVLLQEATLMGYRTYGSDIAAKMIEYSHANLTWLEDHYRLASDNYLLELGDATAHHWHFSALASQNAALAVASESYLGRPFTVLPTPEILAQTISECNLIIKKFLQNLHGQIKPGTRLCLAVPAWHTANGFRHLPTLEKLIELGYNRVSFIHAKAEELIYHREDQIVGRELVTLIRK